MQRDLPHRKGGKWMMDVDGGLSVAWTTGIQCKCFLDERQEENGHFTPR